VSGRPVPPHGSGGGHYIPQPHERRTCLDYRRDDPDETLGRVLFRRAAEAEARQSLALGRRVRLMDDAETSNG
jgi:hypothetical protein